ncbi:hypothetical protein [Nocardia brasiliensis]|uniref:hypothetical protein n=1 Tax=Nocardia brasiliensis TaxID=37326 RepID=UPI002453F610|nr:hypothetical protein [Nocardia brasiliensis]
MVVLFGGEWTVARKTRSVVVLFGGEWTVARKTRSVVVLFGREWTGAGKTRSVVVLAAISGAVLATSAVRYGAVLMDQAACGR